MRSVDLKNKLITPILTKGIKYCNLLVEKVLNKDITIGIYCFDETQYLEFHIGGIGFHTNILDILRKYVIWESLLMLFPLIFQFFSPNKLTP